MKKVATIILNRNLPDITDALTKHLQIFFLKLQAGTQTGQKQGRMVYVIQEV